jgi:hypothetical protein
MREKGIDVRHAEADSLGLGNQPGTTPFVNPSAFERSRFAADAFACQVSAVCVKE